MALHPVAGGPHRCLFSKGLVRERSCLRVAQQDQGEELARCANWPRRLGIVPQGPLRSVSTLVKSPLLRTMLQAE